MNVSTNTAIFDIVADNNKKYCLKKMCGALKLISTWGPLHLKVQQDILLNMEISNKMFKNKWVFGRILDNILG